MSRITAGLLVLALGFGIHGVGQTRESGAALYQAFCAQCHGIRGDGMGINIRDMSVQPRNHTDGEWMSGRSDADLFKAVKEGGLAMSKSLLMPPWGGVLSDDEIHRLVAYMRELCNCTHGSGP